MSIFSKLGDEIEKSIEDAENALVKMFSHKKPEISTPAAPVNTPEPTLPSQQPK